MSKYIIELDDRIKIVTSVGVTKNGVVYTTSDYVHNLEELNSDYINEHFGELQDEAYQKGLEEGKKQAKVQAHFDVCHDIERVAHGNYQKGLDDAWEAARRIVVDTDNGGLALGTLSEIFGTQSYSYIMRENTAQEAIDKIKAYERKDSDRIEVGDIVERYVDGKLDSKGIYLQEDSGYWRCLFDTGAVLMTFAYPKGQFKKTGKHYDIASILEAMRNDR